MKVVFITRKWPPSVGGMETYSVQLVKELSKICNLKVCSLSGRGNGGTPSLFSLALFIIQSSFFIIRNKSPDTVHIGDLVLWPLCIISRLFKPNASIVITAYGLDIVYGAQKGVFPKLYKLYLGIGVKLFGNSIKVVAISNSTAGLCQEVGFHNIAVVPLGVAQTVDQSMEHIETQPYVLFVGRLVKRKGARWFIDNVLPIISNDIRLVVVGKCWDDSERDAVYNNSRVEYLGLVSDKKLKDLRKSAIAVLMPNISTGGNDIEGFGLTALEAAADGGVLLASGIEGITDAVLDAETGFLLPSGDPEAWAKKVHEVRAWSNEDRVCFINNSKRVLAEKFSWKRVAENTYCVYKNSFKAGVEK